MVFYLGAVALALFGGILLPLLLGLPGWVAVGTAPLLIAIRIIITGRERAQPVMDIGNVVVIVLFILKVFL